MAMTPSQKLDAYRFFAIAFDAAPGVTYFGQIADAYAAGWDTKKIVNVYTTKSQFTDIYPTSFSASQFATKLVETVVAENTTVAAKAAAVADIVAALGVGWSRGDVIYTVFNNLANKSFTDPVWGSTAKLLSNEVLVAQYYTETALGNTTDLTTLQVVLNQVSSSSDVSTLSAIAALAAPPHIFTLQESYYQKSVPVAAVADSYVTMWGYNPHAHGETGVDNTIAGTTGASTTNNITSQGTTNLTNEGPLDGGIPLDAALTFIQALAGLNFVQLGLINAASGTDIGKGTVASSTQTFPNATGVTLTNSGSGTQTISITYSDGTVNSAEVALGDMYFKLLHDALYDAQGNTRLYQKLVPGKAAGVTQVSTLQPIVLTQVLNNGGTMEQGYTNAGDDTIVSGRLELLHQSYIDGGPGYNVLEVDAKGTYAQPAELLNIQEIRVNDLPNFYTNSYGAQGAVGNLQNTAVNGVGFLNPVGSGSDDSWLDLSRATAIKKLVVNDSGTVSVAPAGPQTTSDYYGYSGNLTLVGVRNGATLRLEGNFQSGSTTIQYGQGQTGTLNVELALGDVTAAINILQNSAVLNIDSQGVVNHMHSFFAGGSVSRVYIKGTGEFAVDQNIAPSFNQNTAVVIDASANTGGLNINFDGAADVNAGSNAAGRYASVNVKGTATNDTIFVKNVNAYTGDQVASNNGATTITNGKVTIDAGNGDNTVVTDGSKLVKVTTGTGDDTIFTKTADVATIIAGDGSNVINTDASVIVSITSGTGDDNISAQGGTTVTVTAGDGNNIINTDSSATVSITTGAGNDKITSIGSTTVVIDAAAGNNNIAVTATSSVSITTGAGNDTITAVGKDITINSGGGTDSIRLSGTYAEEGLDSSAIGNASDGAQLTINTGATGSATIFFGNDQSGNSPLWSQNLKGVTALDGSTIAGNNVKFYVDSATNLAQADLTGLTGSTKIVVEAGDYLRITSTQFAALGAAAFSEHLDGAGAQMGDVYIVVKAGKAFDLSAMDLTVLSNNVKLHFELQEGANLTLTATQLHNYLATDAITSVSGTNGALAASPNGIVTLKGVGSTFNIADDGDGDRVFGTITEAKVDNLIISRDSTGFNRPTDATTTDTYLIDSTGSVPLVLTSAVSSIATALTITGNQDVDFTASSVRLGAVHAADDSTAGANDYTINWSKLTGKVIGLTIKEFDDAKSITGNDTAANGFNTRVNVMLNGDVGAVGNTKGLTTSGVSQYVVTSIDTDNDGNINEAESASFFLCDNSKDVKVIGLHGNGGNTVTFKQVPWGKVAPVILLEGDGYADWNGGVKADQSPDVSNIGTVIVEFDTTLQGTSGTAVVNINNGGVALGVTSTGGERKFLVDGLTLTGASTATVNVTDGDVTITSLAGANLKTLKFVATEDVAISSNIPTTVTSLSAAGVTGAFTATYTDMSAKWSFVGGAGAANLTLDAVTVNTTEGSGDYGSSITGGTGGVNLTIKTLTASDLSAAVLTNVNKVTMATGSTLGLTLAQVTDIAVADISVDKVGSTAILNLVGLSSQPFAVAAFNKGITIGSVTLASVPVITLDATTNLTGVSTLVVPEGTTLNLTAAQFQQLTAHTITGTGTVNVTNLTQADIDPLDLNHDGDYTDAGEHAALNLAGITTTHKGTVTLGGSVKLLAGDNLGGFEVVMGNDLTLTLADIQQADELTITGGTNTTLAFTDTSAGAAESIDASGFSVTTLKVLNLLVANRNMDLMFDHLPGSVVKEIYNDLGWVEMINQVVTITAGTTVPGSAVFNPITSDTELQNFTLNLKGGTEVSGDLGLATTDKIVGGVDQLRTHLQTLTINSSGAATDTNLLSGATANTITGDITPLAGAGETDNNLLNVVITATQNLVVGVYNEDGTLSAGGSVVFSSVVADDAVTGNDNYSAVAHLTVNGTANVTLGAVDTTDDEVDGLSVVNNSTGTLSLIVDGNLIDDNGGNNVDALSFTGGRIHLSIENAVDLSNDVISGVNHITLLNGSNLTLTQAELIALTVANLSIPDAAGGDTAGLDIVNLGSAAFDVTTLADGIIVGTVTTAAGSITLNAATNLTGVNEIIIPEGSTLTLTAAQFQQLEGSGTIVGVDADGLPSTKITVHITGLTQADVDPLDLNDDGDYLDAGEHANFDLSLVAADKLSVALATTAITVTLGTYETGVLVPGTDSVLNNATFTVGAGQTLGLSNWTQADGLEVTGGTNSTLTFRFDASGGQIDAAGYAVTTLKALATFVGGFNVEDLLLNVPSTVVERYYADAVDLGFVAATNRIVVVEANVTVPGFLMYNDLQDSQEVRTLSFTLEGGSTVEGDLDLSTTTKPGAPAPVQRYFDTLTIVSKGADVNTILGNISALDSDGLLGPIVENNLLKVVINATQALVIGEYDADGAYLSGGDIVFTSLKDASAASLVISGTAAVTVHGLDVTDDNSATATDDIKSLTIDNSGTGLFTATGGTAAIDGKITTLTLKGTGAMSFGTDDLGQGVTAGNLTSINAAALSGALDLGEITDVATTKSFTFTAGTGKTTLTLNGDDLNSPAGAPGAAKSAVWTFDLSTAAAGSSFHLGTNVYGNGADLGDEDTSNGLTIKLGSNTTLYIDENTDFTQLDTFSITGTGSHSIVLAKGVELTLTAAQASGLKIIPAADVITDPLATGYVLADVPVVHVTELGTASYDLSGIAATIAGEVTLTVASDDVTLAATTDLGYFDINLGDLGGDSGSLDGQTIRLSTVAQAARDIVVVNDIGLAGDSSTNVVWLFDTIPGTAPIETKGYDEALGRLWFKTALLTNEGGLVENLFTTLPSSILRVDFASVTLLDILLSSAMVDRTMEFSNFITTGALTFSDIGLSPVEHLHSLDLVLGGQVTIGNVLIDDVIPASGYNPIGADQFTTLTIDSHRALTGRTKASADLPGGNAFPNNLASEAYVNNNDKTTTKGETALPANLNTVGNIGVGAVNGLDLLNVTLNTFGLSVAGDGSAGDGAKLNVGTITYGYVATKATPTETATLTVTGVNDINATAVVTTDPDLTALTVDATGFTGVLTAPGASPALQLGTNETLTFTNGNIAAGTITLGTATNAGVVGAELSTIDASDFDGTLNLGTLALIDGTDDTHGVLPTTDAFSFTSGSGKTTLTLGAANGFHPALAADSTWNFDLTSADAASVLNINSTSVFGAGTLNIDLGVNATLNLVGDVDFSKLVDDPLTLAAEGLNITGGYLTLAAGQTLTLTVAQMQELTVDIVGKGTVKIVGDASGLADLGLNGGVHVLTVGVDISGVTIDLDPLSLNYDGDEVVVFTLGNSNTGTVAVPVDAGRTVVGSAFDDVLALTGDQDSSLTGGLGDDTYDTTGFSASATYNVTSGTDTINGLYNDVVGAILDVLVVSAGATALAPLGDTDVFTASALTINNGTATIDGSATDDTTIDLTLAGGTSGFTITGGTDDLLGNDVLKGSSKADVINGGSDAQSAAAAADTLTGNGGADQFVFNVSTSVPVDLQQDVQLPLSADVELITIMASGAGTDVLRINYSLNGVASSVDTASVGNLATDTAVLTAVANALQALAGITASSDGATVTARGDGGNSLDIISIVAPNVAGDPAFNIDSFTDDVGKVETLTFDPLGTGVVTPGEKYSVSVSMAEGGSINAEYVALLGDTFDDVAVGVSNAFNGLAAALTVDAMVVLPGSGIITFSDENLDNGAFTLTATSVGTVDGTGASELGAADVTTADAITDFLSGTDKIVLGIADGSGANYDEAAQVADYATALGDANTAFDGTVQYYLSSVLETTLGDADGPYGVLFFDANGDGSVDGVVKLVGIDSAHFAATDILAVTI